MELCTLASGSKGNSSLICSDSASVLVDIGLSTKQLCSALSKVGKRVEDLAGIFITHEHRDHILGLKTFINKYKIPILGTAETLDEIFEILSLKEEDKPLFHILEKDEAFSFQDMKVQTFPIPHDAANPIGFTFQKEGKKVAICTDIGRITEEVKAHLVGSNALLVEANHDEHILQAGKYPYSLKKRILSDLGHLSNENSGKLLSEIWHRDLKQVFLGHLSKENNLPELALLSVKCELSEKHQEYEKYTKICVASQTEVSECVCV